MNHSFIEKRKYKRHDVTNFVVATLPNRLGRLINISENGLAIQLYDEDIENLPQMFKTSLLTAAKGFLIEDLPLKLVRKEVKPSTSMSTVAVEIATTDTKQHDKIREYISGLS